MEQAARDHQLQLDEEVARALQAVDETRPVAPAPVNAADQSVTKLFCLNTKLFLH